MVPKLKKYNPKPIRQMPVTGLNLSFLSSTSLPIAPETEPFDTVRARCDCDLYEMTPTPQMEDIRAFL
jgi:hypothetical protein